MLEGEDHEKCAPPRGQSVPRLLAFRVERS